jgi:hypothetical protein
LVLAVSCLVLGFVAGWALRGGEDSPIIIPAAASEPTPTATVEAPQPAPPPAASTDIETTSATDTTATGPSTVTETEPPAPEPTLPEPSAIQAAVLNGSGVTGLAGETTTKMEGLGYTGVTPGNTAAQTGPTIVYFRPGGDNAARKVAQDLGYGLAQVKPLTNAALVAEAPATAQVIVVLGPG